MNIARLKQLPIAQNALALKHAMGFRARIWNLMNGFEPLADTALEIRGRMETLQDKGNVAASATFAMNTLSYLEGKDLKYLNDVEKAQILKMLGNQLASLGKHKGSLQHYKLAISLSFTAAPGLAAETCGRGIDACDAALMDARADLKSSPDSSLAAFAAAMKMSNIYYEQASFYQSFVHLLRANGIEASNWTMNKAADCIDRSDTYRRIAITQKNVFELSGKLSAKQ